jgi:UDP-glucose 4-epimerase
LKGCGAIIHLVARVHVMHDPEPEPLKAFREINVKGTERLCRQACEMGVRRFIFVSSIKVNGEATNGHAFRADDAPNFQDPYGQSKWEAEERLKSIAEEAGMEWVVVRPPLVYGPGVRGNFLTLLSCVSRGLPLPLGGVHNQRSLVGVQNLANLLNVVIDHPAAAGKRFLVKDGEDVSTPELIRKVAMALHRTPRLIPIPESLLLTAGTLLQRRPAVERLCGSLVVDTTETNAILQWTPPHSLDSGLQSTARWFLNGAGLTASSL